MKTILVAAALAAVWSGAPASAQTSSRAVTVRDLDLGRPADIARLDRRLAAAAKAVCAEPGAATYGNYAAAKSCERATRRAVIARRNAIVSAAQGTALAAR